MSASGKSKAIVVFVSSAIIFILGISFLIIASERGEVDKNDAGHAEEILGLTLLHDGEFSIIISDFAYNAGEYRLTLKDSTTTSAIEEEFFQNSGENLLSDGAINYGQFIYKSGFNTPGLAPFCHSRNLLAGI